jgi:hypothetical protein
MIGLVVVVAVLFGSTVYLGKLSYSFYIELHSTRKRVTYYTMRMEYWRREYYGATGHRGYVPATDEDDARLWLLDLEDQALLERFTKAGLECK